MQESTVRRRDCSGVMTLAGAPSWVRGRGFDLKIFRRMVRLLSIQSKNFLPGKSQEQKVLH
jgi:hypothetical protein